MRLLFTVLTGGLLVFGAMGQTTALAEVWPGNGHDYEAVLAPDGITWDAANAAAVASGKHLATITSAAENDFVFSLLSAPELWVRPAGPL